MNEYNIKKLNISNNSLYKVYLNLYFSGFIYLWYYILSDIPGILSDSFNN